MNTARYNIQTNLNIHQLINKILIMDNHNMFHILNNKLILNNMLILNNNFILNNKLIIPNNKFSF